MFPFGFVVALPSLFFGALGTFRSPVPRLASEPCAAEVAVFRVAERALVDDFVRVFGTLVKARIIRVVTLVAVEQHALQKNISWSDTPERTI